MSQESTSSVPRTSMLHRIHEDIFLEILAFIDVLDVPRLEKTCTAIRKSLSTFNAWLVIFHNLSLEHTPVLPPFSNVKSLSVQQIRKAVASAVRSHNAWTSETVYASRKQAVPLDLRDSAWDDTRKFRLVHGSDIYLQYELIRQREAVGGNPKHLSLSCYSFGSTAPFISFKSQYSTQGSLHLDGSAAGFEIYQITPGLVRAAHCTLQTQQASSMARAHLIIEVIDYHIPEASSTVKLSRAINGEDVPEFHNFLESAYAEVVLAINGPHIAICVRSMLFILDVESRQWVFLTLAPNTTARRIILTKSEIIVLIVTLGIQEGNSVHVILMAASMSSVLEANASDYSPQKPVPRSSSFADVVSGARTIHCPTDVLPGRPLELMQRPTQMTPHDANWLASTGYRREEGIVKTISLIMCMGREVEDIGYTDQHLLAFMFVVRKTQANGRLMYTFAVHSASKPISVLRTRWNRSLQTIWLSPVSHSGRFVCRFAEGIPGMRATDHRAMTLSDLWGTEEKEAIPALSIVLCKSVMQFYRHVYPALQYENGDVYCVDDLQLSIEHFD